MKRAYAKLNRIKILPSHKGELHRDLGVPEGEPIVEDALEDAKNSDDPAVRRRAVFAENARQWGKK